MAEHGHAIAFDDDWMTVYLNDGESAPDKVCVKNGNRSSSTAYVRQDVYRALHSAIQEERERAEMWERVANDNMALINVLLRTNEDLRTIIKGGNDD